MNQWIHQIHEEIKKDYTEQNRILSFQEYVEHVKKNPRCHLRSSAQYVIDMMDHFGRDGDRFKLFDQTFTDGRGKVIGQEAVQLQIYNALQAFVREGINNKLILLHGPNGSAKSSIIACLMRGLEHYSAGSEGALYRFHWIFPVDRHGKPSFGLAADRADRKGGFSDEESFAKLPDDEIAARISCDLRDHPMFLVPVEERAAMLEKLDVSAKWTNSEYLLKGDLSQKSKKIFEALLRNYKGDYEKVLRHVQVERFYVSKRYRESAVTIEPQMHVDAEARQITMDKSVTMLPSSLHFLSLFDLGGDLVAANRGIVEYNDMLKRPIDAFKYLLSTTETGTVSVGGTVAFIDTVMLGTCNEAQLDAFKEYPDFPSFKARIELVRVPYLLEVPREADIYKAQIQRLVGNAHVTPHVLETAALWAVLSRLKKPNPSHYPTNLAYLINSLTPMEKANLYADGTVPVRLSSEERKMLKAHSEEIRREYSSVPYYEGRVGPSPREMKNILFTAFERHKQQILSPINLFEVLEEFVKRSSEYEYLRENVVEGYHDCRAFIKTARENYLHKLDREVRNSLGVHDDKQYENFLKKYVQHLTAHVKKEKIKNNMTGTLENPDPALMEEFEKVVKISEDKETFRQNIMTQLGVYALENPAKAGQTMDYTKVFADLLDRIRDYYFAEHSSLMRRIHDAITLFEVAEGQAARPAKTVEQIEAEKLAHTMISNMKTKYGYNDISARETFLYLVQKQY